MLAISSRVGCAGPDRQAARSRQVACRQHSLTGRRAALPGCRPAQRHSCCQAGLDSYAALAPPEALLAAIGQPGPWPLAALPVPGLPFPIPGLDIFTLLGFLLNNPVVTVALAVGVYVFLPRLWRWVLKRIVVPALVLAAVFFAAQHPAQTVFLGKSVLAFIGSNPVLVSAVTIGALAVVLSPYILVAGAVFGLIYGLPQLPAPFNALVPAPVVEAEHKFESFSRFLRRQAPAYIAPDLVQDSSRWRH